MAGWTALRGNLYNLINDDKTALAVQEVYKYPKMKFGGYPAVAISPSDVESDFQTTTENDRDYVFKVRVFEPSKDQGLSVAIDKLEVVVDSIMTQIAEDGGAAVPVMSQNLGSQEVYIFTRAIPGVWGVTVDEALVFNEMTVVVRLSVDIV